VDQCFSTGTIIGIRQKAFDLMPVPDWYESFLKKVPQPRYLSGYEKRGPKKKPILGPVGYVQKLIPIKHWFVMGTV
jgi:hypothetical protein